jgi:hypothetical protein
VNFAHFKFLTVSLLCSHYLSVTFSDYEIAKKLNYDYYNKISYPCER